MAMTIFFLLNGMGVVFLLYVLANFWKEGHRPKSNARKYATEYGRRDWADVFVVTHPISHCCPGRPFRDSVSAARPGYSDKPARKCGLIWSHSKRR